MYTVANIIISNFIKYEWSERAAPSSVVKSGEVNSKKAECELMPFYIVSVFIVETPAREGWTPPS